MNPIYKKVLSRCKEISALVSASGLCGWDQETMLPPRGIEARSEQEAALSGVIHEKVTDPALGKMLRALTRNPTGLTADERACVREWLRDYEHSVKLPADLVREMAKVTSLSQPAWIKARKASDFKQFAPWLEKVIALKRREADALGYKGCRYDALLDNYEPGMTVAELDPIIRRVREGLVPIVDAIARSREKVSDAILKRRYPEAAQEAMCGEMMAAIGVDTEAARLDRSAHPFCCGIASTDVRITTRYDERWLPGSIYGVIHESGHALYEQGLQEKHYGTPLAEAVSLGIHESQSRFWENMIGRSRPFVRYLFPRLRKRFPSALRGVDAEQFYRSINRVEATTIRVESDEVTYNLHIVLRYELERELVAGSIKVKDLPALWNERMRKYLGIAPKNDAEGVLQDTHWPQGLVGYFPTYLLGNLNAAQLWRALRKDLRNPESQVSMGEFSKILGWLRTNVHQHGRRYKPSELMERATGEKPNPIYFLEYLKEKYGEIYKINKW